MNPNEDDAASRDLLFLYLGGDREAFVQLYRRHEDRVRILVRFLAGLEPKDPEIDDLAQQVWLGVAQNAGRFRGESRFTTWLEGIVRNACALEGRKQKRHDAACSELQESRRRERPWEPGPKYEKLDHAGLGPEVDKALEQVPPEQREAFLLRHREELDVGEIAERQGVPWKTALRRIEMCAEKLRRILARFNPDPDNLDQRRTTS
jgi:RNA polymerase sigma-70 factor (ECF subfamily)